MGKYHVPALLQQVCTLLEIKPDGKYIDATLGGAGHTKEILSLGGWVLGIDQDQDAINNALADEDLQPALSSSGDGPKFIPVYGNFQHIKELAASKSWTSVDGILFDLGVSLHQFSTGGRGFSFQSEAPLDMRMDNSFGLTAGELLNTLSVKQIEQLLRDYGEVTQGKSLAQKIVSQKPITTTTQLADIIPVNLRPQVFQAIRIAVNDELGAITKALPQALGLLAPAGRIAVISFHSLEDRIVKDFFNDWVGLRLGKLITDKPVIPAAEEITANPQSRSAKLRVFQKNI